jgi:hypothetical protein
MDGGVSAQVVIGQIGGKSIELLHSGCIWPSTQRQTHDASALAVRKTPEATVRINRPISSPKPPRGLTWRSATEKSYSSFM